MSWGIHIVHFYLNWQHKSARRDSHSICVLLVHDFICAKQMKLFPVSNCNKEKSPAPRGQFGVQERKKRYRAGQVQKKENYYKWESGFDRNILRALKYSWYPYYRMLIEAKLLSASFYCWIIWVYVPSKTKIRVYKTDCIPTMYPILNYISISVLLWLKYS